MSKSPETASLGPHLPGVYRFAFLMTGEAAAAAAVLRRTVERAALGGVTEFRDAGQVRRWLFNEARHQCARHADAEPDALRGDEGAEPDAAARLAARFGALPPAERSALILFYLYLFDPTELAEVLEIPVAELAPTLTRGRVLLRETP